MINISECTPFSSRCASFVHASVFISKFAVSGTAKQHTTYDYAARIASGYSDAIDVSNTAFSVLTQVSWCVCMFSEQA
jgi:hypothetical protein